MNQIPPKELAEKVHKLAHPWVTKIQESSSVLKFIAYFFVIPLLIATIHDILLAPNESEAQQQIEEEVIPPQVQQQPLPGSGSSEQSYILIGDWEEDYSYLHFLRLQEALQRQKYLEIMQQIQQ